MLYRKASKVLRKWLNSSEKAILVTGVRQAGKTFLIRSILKEENRDFVELNLLKEPELVSLLETARNRNAEEFLSRLSLAVKRPLAKGRTIVFLDEVQECKEILTAIKFLAEEGSFRYVLSGSLLGVELTDLRSAPVGYLSVAEMFPLDFEEFLLALGIPEETLGGLRRCFERRTPVDEFVHGRIMDALHAYLVVGGMPAAVQKYVDENDFNLVSRIHREIVAQYKWDFTKYEAASKLRLIAIYDLIPSELNAKNKRYMFADLGEKKKFARYENSFNWLVDAGVALPAFNTTEPVVPLKINRQSNLFKLFLSDVGLLTTLYGRATQIQLMRKDKGINCGAIFENFVAQELKAHGYEGYYYNSKKLGELDFVVEHEGKCLPIEVKSGKDYSRHAALDNVLKVANYDIPQAFVFSNANVSVKGKIAYLPIYMTMFLDEPSRPLPNPAKIDLSDLGG